MSKEVKYSKKFKLDALNLLQVGKSLSDISKSLGISVNTPAHGVDAINCMAIKLSKD